MTEYKTIDKLNQSLLKEILKSPRSFKKAKEKYEAEDTSVASHYIFGSAVDHLITEEIEFTDKFYVMKNSSISDSIKNIIDHIWSETVVDDLSHAYESIVRACSYENYQPRWKEETRVKKIIEDGSNYYEDLKKAVGKQIISGNDYNKAIIAQASLMSDPYIGKYLKPRKGQELIKKKVIEFVVEDIEFKCELDLVFIDHNLKEITPIDLKTTGSSIYSFPYNFWKLRYDFQAAVYSHALQEAVYKNPKFKDYTINDFKFFVVEKEGNNKPMIFSTNKEILSIGIKGGILENGKVLEGFEQAIERYKYHTVVDNWDYPMEYLNEGQINLYL